MANPFSLLKTAQNSWMQGKSLVQNKDQHNWLMQMLWKAVLDNSSNIKREAQ
jgi:hypothetical protein